jgi:hypothetical protein
VRSVSGNSTAAFNGITQLTTKLSYFIHRTLARRQLSPNT